MYASGAIGVEAAGRAEVRNLGWPRTLRVRERDSGLPNKAKTPFKTIEYPLPVDPQRTALAGNSGMYRSLTPAASPGGTRIVNGRCQSSF